MAIAYKSAGNGAATEASGGDLNPTCPATVDAGDILIAHVAYEGVATTPSTPSGWELLTASGYAIETSAYKHWIFGKIADGTEDGAAISFGTPAVTTMRTGRIYSFSGRASGTILQCVPTASFAHVSNATDPTFPDVTTTVAGALAVACIFQADDNALVSATGETGGDWVEAVAEYMQTATTPDSQLGLQTCTPTANPGTVTGGTISTANDPVGVIGFQIIGNFTPTVALNTPTDASSTTDNTPILNFTGTDADGDALEYNIQVDNTSSFSSTGWDVSTGAYSGFSLSSAAEETNSRDIAFSSDGTKAYVIGTLQNVRQYTLTVPWDISSGSYASKTLFVGSQELTPCGLAFSSDGTKAYIVGTGNDTVYQYTLSTAWDVSTGSYASKSMSVTAQDIYPHGLAFSSDGTKAYMSGINSDSVYQYTLSTAWDVSTGSYASKSISVVTQDDFPIGINFSTDGTKMYVVGDTTNSVYQYSLVTPWDVSTGSYADKKMSVGSQDASVHGIAFSSDGTKLYAIGDTSDTIFQYTLGTAAISKFSVSDAGFTAGGGGSIDYTVQSANALGEGTYYWRVRAIDPSGSNMYGAWSSARSFTVGLVTVALNTPTDTQTITDSTPALNFTGTDVNSGTIEYNVQIDTVNTFNSGTTTANNILVDSYPISYSVGYVEMHIASPYYTRIGQSFDSGGGGILASASFKLGKIGSPTGTMVAKLYAHTGTYGTTGVPTGSALATSATIDVTSFSSGSTVSFDFGAAAYTLSASTKYVVDVEYSDASSSASKCITMYLDSSGSHAGICEVWDNNASSWIAVTDYDTCFYVYIKGPYLSKFSITDVGFLDSPDQGDTHPFTSATAVEYTVQSALSDGTYYWRVAGKDPSISTNYGAWSSVRSFTYTAPFNISGTSDQTSGTVSVAVNNTLQGQTGTILGDGTWTITGVTKPSSGDSITVFISNAATADVSTAFTTYSGTGEIGGMVLNRHVLSIGSDQNRSITLADMADYDYDQDTSHIMHSVNGTPYTLLVDANNLYSDDKISILTGNTLTLGSGETLTAYDVVIGGTLASSGGSIFNVTHNWTNNGTFTASTSTANLSGTTQQTLSGTMTTSSAFYDLAVTNNSGQSTPSFTPGVIFAASATIGNNYTINTADVRVQYASDSTYTLNNVSWNGQSTSSRIYFRSSSTNAWKAIVTGAQSISYVNVANSDADETGSDGFFAGAGTNYDAGTNTKWYFSNTRVRQEVNIIDGTYSASGDSNEIIRIDTTKYGGTLTYKFEIVAKVTSGTGTVTLHDSSNNIHATITVSGTTFAKLTEVCSTAPTTDTYHINLSGGTGLTVQAARLIILDDFGDGADIDLIETQIEVGNNETGKTNTSSSPLSYPKYWQYTATNWAGNNTFLAEVSYKVVTTGSVTVTLQKDAAGDLSTWSDVVTIVNAQTQTTPTLSSRVEFTPVISCNYRIAAYITANSYDVYNAKIIVDQDSGGGLTGNVSTISTVSYYIDGTSVYPTEPTNIFLVVETAQRGIFVKTDGTRGYFLTNTTKTLYQADFGTAWDMSTATYNSVSYSLSALTSVYAPFFKPDGSKLYIIDDQAASQVIYQYSLGTAWDLGGTVSLDKSQALPGIGSELAIKDSYITADGTKLFVVGATSSLVYALSFGTAWDVATLSYVGSYSPGITPGSIWFSPDGMKMYVGSGSSNTLNQYTLTTAWVITSGVTNDGYTGSLSDTGTSGICFSPDLSKMYSGGATADRWNEFSTGIDYSAPSAITGIEPQYLIQNTNSSTTGLQDYDITWDPADWQGIVNTYYHEIDISSDTADAAKLQTDPNGTPADITGSSATGTAYRSRSSAFTMSTTLQTIDTNITNVPVYASRLIVGLQVPSVPTVTSPTATSVVLPNATLGATVTSNGGLTLTARGTVWGTSPSPTGNALAEGGTSTGEFSHSRSSITKGVVIYFRGYATNAKGTAYSEDGILIPGPNNAVQFDSDHETILMTGDSTSNTSVFLDFSVATLNSSETVTPKVEVRPIGSSLTGSSTHSGDSFNFSPSVPRFRTYPATIYDSVNHRMIVFGGKDDNASYLNDTWELKLPTSNNPNPIWRQMSPSGTPPTGRTAMVYVYDSVAERMIIFGGTNGAALGGFYALDTSTADGAWSTFDPIGTDPANRFTSAGIFDVTNRRMIIFGGWTTADNNDTWSITLPDDLATSTSTLLSPGGTLPSVRSEHSLIYDSANQRMILFAGWGAAFYNDVRVLSLTSGSEAWSTPTIVNTAPSIRSSHVAVYDPVNQRMVITQGREQIGANWYFRNDVYSLAIPSGTTFTWTNNTAATGSLPAKRYAAGAAYDSVNKRMMTFGGLDEVLSILANETIFYDLSVSSGTLYGQELYPTVNLMMGDGSVAVYDSQNKQMIRYGGYGRIYDLSDPEGTGYHHSEVWAYTTDANSASYNFLNNITPSAGPLAGEVAAIVYDTTYNRLVRFGSLGYNQDQGLNDTWGMSLDPSRADYHVWKRFTTSGGPPAVRWGAAVIYDAPNSRMIVFGGSEAGTTSTHYNDVWQLSLPDPDDNGGNPTYTWSQITPSGTPPSERFQSTGIYDPDNIRMLIFGGRSSTDTYLYDLWELDWGANPNHNTFTWYNRTPGSNNPTGRRGHTAVYDSTYDRMIMFGGWNGSSTHYNDVWSLSTTTPGSEAWTSITTSGTPPIVRRSHNAIFDPVTQRMVIQGGRGALSPVNFLSDFWELTLPSGTTGWTWSQLSPIVHQKASVPITSLTNNTGYHWQAWATGSVSGDTIKISYGGNSESSSDFIVGTISFSSSIKTVDGLAFEYVKTMNSLIVANVKSIDGLE